MDLRRTDERNRWSCRSPKWGRAVAVNRLPPGASVALVVAEDGVALAWYGGDEWVPTDDAAAVVRALASVDPRWTWWSARETAAPLIAAGAELRTCWDLGAVERLLGGLRRDDPAAVWAAAHGLPEPEPVRPSAGPVRPRRRLGRRRPLRADGQLDQHWLTGGWAATGENARAWARLIVGVQARQEELPEGDPGPKAAAWPDTTRGADGPVGVCRGTPRGRTRAPRPAHRHRRRRRPARGDDRAPTEHRSRGDGDPGRTRPGGAQADSRARRSTCGARRR